MAHEKFAVFGPFRLDVGTESVWRASEEIRLRPKAFAVLRYLVERPTRLITKEELLKAVWPEVAVGDAALAVCVAELRKALDDDARTPRFIETVHRRGYRFIGAVESRADRISPSRIVGIVGRDDALGRLRGWLERALHGERQVIFVTGAPGIGKTALVDAFVASLPAGDFWLARGQCLDHYGAGEPYLPVLDALTRLARGPGGDRIVAALGQHAPTWLAQMPGLLGAAELLALQPRIAGTTRERMLREMAEALESIAAERPLALVLEDLHWSDHSTLDLIAAVAQRREPAALLLIGTYRPIDVIARRHPLRSVTQELALHGSCEELPLDLLDETDVARYLTGRFGLEVSRLLAGVVHRRTDGLPLFMISVVDALVRRGILTEAAGQWVLNAGSAEIETSVPAGLRQMIEQQLSALEPSEQQLLEAASVAGTAFSAASLAAALDDGVEAVEDRCEALVRREQFIRSSGVEEWPDGTVAARYRFLHVFYQQVLYERLPAGRTVSLHRRIAEREEEGYRLRLDERAAALAVHFEHGRAGPRALHYHRQAAGHALQRCAYREAIEHLTRARQLLETVPDSAERLALKLDLQDRLGAALYTLHAPAAGVAEAEFLRTRELAERDGDPARLRLALWGLWSVNYFRGRFAEAREIGEHLLTLAEGGSDTGALLEAHHALWGTLVANGELAAGLVHIEQGQRLYDPERHREQGILYGNHDVGTCAWDHLAAARLLLGYPDAALTALQEGRALAARLDHPPTSVRNLCFASWIHYLRGDLAEARDCAQQLVALAPAHGISSLEDDGQVVLACVASPGAGRERSLAELYEWLGSHSARRIPTNNIICLCALARAAADEGNVDLGFRIMEAIPEAHRGAYLAPEIERMRGELLLLRGQWSDAEDCFGRAIDTARRRAERFLELRAATSLARLLTRKRRRDEARRALGEIYAWFTEGFDTADLRDARALLDQLGRPRKSS